MVSLDKERAEERDRGRQASRPSEMPLRGWRDILIRVWNESGYDNIGLIAAGVAFYAFLALVPLLAAVVLSYAVLADPKTIVETLQALARMLPADAARLVGEQIVAAVQAAEGKTGWGLLLALGLALYGAMRGSSAMMSALNIIYEEREKRSLVKTTLISLAITAGGVIAALLAIAAMSMVGFVERILPGAPPFVRLLAQILSWVLLGAVAAAATATIYRYGPSRRKARWCWLTPGSVLTCVFVLAATFGFGLYVANFSSYNATYGSLGAVVVLLMWLYLSAYVLLLGAELNAELEHQTERDTTRGRPRPLGSRGAQMADTVGETP
jgi:membrane protein